MGHLLSLMEIQLICVHSTNFLKNPPCAKMGADLIGLPESANKNTGGPVEWEFQINKNNFFWFKYVLNIYGSPSWEEFYLQILSISLSFNDTLLVLI